MSDIEPQPVTVRLEEGEIDESSESFVATSPVIGFTHPILSAKRGNDSNYDEIAAVLSKLGEGDDKDPMPDQTDIPTSSSQVYRNDDESDLIDEDEMLCVRGASPMSFFGYQRSLIRKTPPCDSDDFNREVITSQKRRKTSSKRRRTKRSTPRKAERSISSEEDRKDTKSKDGSQSPTTPPQKLNQLCKFYLQDACAKGRSCEYMHSEFPCKFYYTDSRCEDMEKNGRCKLSHNGPLSDDMMATLIRHLYTAPNELLGEKFIELRAKIAPGDFSVMIHRMHEKLLSQAEDSETGPVLSEPNIIATMREQLSYILSDEQLAKLTQLRLSKYEDLLSLTLAQFNAIGISAIQIEAIQLTFLSSQDIDMRCLFPQCVPKPAEPYEVGLPAGDIDLRASKWDEEDEQPLVIDESYEVQETKVENDEDDIIIDVVGDVTPPFSEESDVTYSNSNEVVICSAIDKMSSIAEQHHSDTTDSEVIDVVTVILSADNTPLVNPVSPKCDTAEVTIVNEMLAQADEESLTPPPKEQVESYTPPPNEEKEEDYTSPPKVEEESYTPLPKEERYTPPATEVKQLSPLALEVLDTLDHAIDHQEQLKQDVAEFKEDVKEPKDLLFDEPLERSTTSRRNIRFIDPTNITDIKPPECRDERKVAFNRRRRHKRIDSDNWKYRNEPKEAPKGNSDSRENNYSHRNATFSNKKPMEEVSWRQYQKQVEYTSQNATKQSHNAVNCRSMQNQNHLERESDLHSSYIVDRQMQDNNSSEDWDAEEQNETVVAPKPKDTAATGIDSPDNSDVETTPIFASSTCPDFPRRIPNLDNYKPALEIDAHLTYPAMEYKLYEIFLPHFEVNKPTLMDKLVRANSSDPRLKKFLEKEKNYGFLPQTDYSFFPPACNSQGDPRLRFANACPEPNYNSSPILYGYLQRSLWYQELKSNLKIQINHSVSDLVRALNAFHKDPTPNKIFDLFQIECAGVLLEVMQNVGIFIDVHGGIIELGNYQQLCAPAQLPQSQPYTNNNNGNNYSGSASLPLKPGLLGYAPPGMYPHPPMTPQNSEKNFMQQAFCNDYPLDCNNNNNNNGVQPPESGFYVRDRNFNRNCGGDGNAGVGPSNFKQSRSHYRRPQKVHFNRRM